MTNFKSVCRALFCILALSIAVSACGGSNANDNKSKGGLQGSWKPSKLACVTGQETAQLQQATDRMSKDLWYVFDTNLQASTLSVRQTIQSQTGLTTVDGSPSCTSEDNYKVTLNGTDQMTVNGVNCKSCGFNYTNPQNQQQSQVELGCGNFTEGANMTYAMNGDSLNVTVDLPNNVPVQQLCTGATAQKITLVLKKN